LEEAMMTVESLTIWVLVRMVTLLSPLLAHGLSDIDKTEHRWAETYPLTAAAIADASVRHPVFKGEDGAKKTAAMLVAWAYHESRFDPRALGDHGTALGLFQIHSSTVPDVPKDELFDPDRASVVARDLMLQSFRICSAFPLEERGGWYAAGGEGCKEEGRKKSRVRMMLAKHIAKEDQP
jgi:hypothetical protein